jgi:hypothetical protein
VPNRLLTLRIAALMGAGTLALHELRFLIPYGDGSSATQAAEGHGYLVPVTPVLAGLLLLAFAAALARVARGAADRAPRLTTVWAGASASLLAVYCAQESIEALVVAHHPAGLAGVVGNGGWIALPLAVVIGLAIAIAVRGAAEAPAALAPGNAPLTAALTGPAEVLLAPDWLPRQLAGAARHLAPRGPPAVLR